MRYYKYSLFIFVFAVSLGTSGMADEKPLILVAQKYASESEDRLLFQEEIITAAFDHAGYKIQYKYRPWKRCLIEVREGRHDAAYTAWHTKERSEIYGFSDTYLYVDTMLFKKKGKAVYYNGDLQTLKPYLIGVSMGWTISPEFDSADYLQKTFVSEPIQLIKMLYSERIDIMALSVALNQALIKNYPEYKGGIVPLPPPLKRNTTHVIFSKKISGYESRIEAFNEGLKKIIENGTLRKIEEKYQYTSGLLQK
ncbi:substrate-binding periplasmic protein [Desulfosarcina ovata]|nr:transporter substrate-binding domain-containing protein [Desulfosarcina ovata]